MTFVALVVVFAILWYSFLMYVRLLDSVQKIKAMNKLVFLTFSMSLLLLILLKVGATLELYALLVGLLTAIFSIYFSIKYHNLKLLARRNKVRRVR